MRDNLSSQGGQTPLILFATPPPLDQLRAVSIYIPDSIKGQGISKFQPQVIKCREFIFTEPDVIGTPSPEINDHSFHLIAQVSLIKSGKLQNRLSRVGLKVSSPYEVSTKLYQACLRYTITARLSPSWNKCGPWLVQGRDFLTMRGCANAVKMEVTVIHNELFFTLEAGAVKMAPLQIADLDILGKHMDHYLRNPASTIEHDYIAADWCYVLPSMKRGRIASINHKIPEDSPFTTYRDLKRHWKNTYGYRLPETDEDLNFCQISFGAFGGKHFTYPDVCLRPRELQRVNRIDPKPILRAFVVDVQNKFPTICGAPIKLQTKAKFTVSDLLPCEQATGQPNLTSKMGSSRAAVYRSMSEMEKLFVTPAAPSRTLQSIQAQVQAPSNLRNIAASNEYATVRSTMVSSQTASKTPVSTVAAQNIKNMDKIRSLPTGKENRNNNSARNNNQASNVGSEKPTYLSSVRSLGVTGAPKHFSQAVVQSSGNTGNSTSNTNMAGKVVSSVTPNTAQRITSHQQSMRDSNPHHSQAVISSQFKLQFDTSETPCSSQMIPDTQQGAVARKLFPSFKAKKPATGIVASSSVKKPAPKQVPVFASQKKTSGQSSARSNTGKTQTMNSSIVGPGSTSIPLSMQVSRSSSSGIVPGIPLSMQATTPRATDTPKTAPSHCGGSMPGPQKSVPLFHKATTHTISSKPAVNKTAAGKKAGKKSEAGKGKSQTTKGTKRATDGKKGESKRIKKLKAAEQ